jgi:hypothetical protein
MNNKDQYNNDTWYGDKENQVHGNIIGGEKVNLSKIGSSSSIVIGRGTQSYIQQGKNLEFFEYSYESVYEAIKARPEEPNLQKDSLEFLARQLHNELVQDGLPDHTRINRLLKQLSSLAPDIFERATTVLLDDNAGLSPEIHHLVERIREDCRPDIQTNKPIDEYLEKELTIHNLTPDKSKQMREDLNQLRLAVDSGNIPPVRQLLYELTHELPGMKRPLRHWLVESPATSPAIKILARNYLD